MSAGFHMSFSATAALVVFYNYWRGLGFERYRPGIMAAIMRNMTGITLTSLVAGTVTSAYAVLHFNRLASYGFFGNILAMPLFTFVVMPAALMSLFLMPFGLEATPLAVMGWGIKLILDISQWLESWTGAQLYVATTPGWVLSLFSLGFIFLCLGRHFLVVTGCILISLCVLFWDAAPQPDMRISESGQVAFWDSQQLRLYVSSQRSDRYGREQFMRRAGRTDIPLLTYSEADALCDAQACRFEVNGKMISIGHTPEILPEDCAASDLILLKGRAAGPLMRRQCKAVLIDADDLARNGAYDIFIPRDTQPISYHYARNQRRAQRMWARGYNSDRERQ